MIIKRKHAGQLSPNIGDELLPGMAETLAEPPEEIIEWNEETVGAGLAPERRTRIVATIVVAGIAGWKTRG